MTDCRDFFVQLYKDASTEYWEFDHEGWRSPTESARFQIKVENGAAVVITGIKEDGKDEPLWVPDERLWPTFEDAALCAIERYFTQDCFVRTVLEGPVNRFDPCPTSPVSEKEPVR